MSCIERSPVIKTLVPNIAEEKQIHKRSSSDSVCDRTDPAILCEKVARLRGNINTCFIFTIPSDREYLGYHGKDPMGMYSIYEEKFSAGASFALHDQEKTSETAKAAIDLHASVPIGEGQVGGAYNAGSSKNYSDHQDCRTNQTLIRIVVSGGINGCWCCSPQSTLDVFVCSRKKDGSPSPRHPNEPIDAGKTLHQQVQNTADMSKQNNASHPCCEHPCQVPRDEILSPPREE